MEKISVKTHLALLASIALSKPLTYPHLNPTLYHSLVLTFGLSLLLRLLRNYILVPFLFVPSVFLTRTQEHKRYMDHERSKMNAFCPERLNFFKIYTPDGAVLDAMELLHPLHPRCIKINEQQQQQQQNNNNQENNNNNNNQEKNNNKWLLWVNPNGGAYEHLLEFLYKYSNDVGVSVLAFNYRGVGRSTGSPTVAADLVLDTETAFKYLLDQGVRSEDILMHGHSLGGGISAEVRAKYPNGPIINDRSFSSFNDTVQSLVVREPFLGALLGGIVGFFVFALAGGAIQHCYLKGALYGGLGAVAMGYVGSKSVKVLLPAISGSLSMIGWHMHVSEHWKKIQGHKVVLYHQLDGLISHDMASLYSALAIKSTSEKSAEKTRYVRLSYKYVESGSPILYEHQMYHVYPLDTLQEDWNLIVAEAKRGLHIK